MANFPAITPTYGAAKTSQPNMRQVQFGDGYAQVIRFGLNQNPKTWNLRWEISETDADTIETFLNARADDGATFGWTPLDSSTAYKWRCLAWTKSLIYKNRVSLKATFVQYFEP